jgi:hypothetical protein
MLEVTSAKYLDGYRIRVQFNDGQEGDVDLGDALWGPVFEPLHDLSLFQRFWVSEALHTIHWENNADLAPEYLLAKMIEQRHAVQQGT